ncbi:putative electron transfer flavoprotein-ubiquinone oxidoreductase, mitochondrial [Hypsizygus marmoreus]|uniref:Electron transfer flavoprotein-ubiquinone oxidoreductase n=1 Tax=Hypsizygus marmoreus TaxID=39966 RepID=A0A369K7C8_HYPMA|nr:putative electron transfer flavoprotein-ubiquinone oxidoreductase, mitochondrial [Hypsizygus marmoreus]
MLRPLTTRAATRLTRTIHSSAPRKSLFNPKDVERAEDEVDVCIVGGGPAGLSAAIRLKQLERERGNEIRVVVLEKGGEIGAHIVSGAVIEPRALNELLPEWQSLPDHPLTQPATSSSMVLLTPKLALPMPHPPQMSNKGNYIVSLSQFTRWLGSVAENEYGVEVYPGFAAAQLLLSKEADSLDPWGNPVKSVRGVITNEVGLTKNFGMKSSFEPGMAFNAKVTLLAEGAHGSLSKLAIQKYQLRKESQPQTYGIGVKEVWRVDPEQYKPGKVVHTLGWPLDTSTYGGGWIYHMDGGLVSLGLVVGLDYKNPYLSPYRELQRLKHHPYFRKLLASGERVSYAARVLTEGGLQSIPKLHFPGGALIGCSAGFVNIAKIKGTHNAMKSGMLAAEAAYNAIHPAESTSESTSSEAEEAVTPPATNMSAYDAALRASWVWKDLYEVRNLRPSFSTRLGMWGGVAYSGIDSLFLKGRVPWTFKHAPSSALNKYMNGKSFDAAHTELASKHTPIAYPPFEAPLSTDLMTSVALTGTNHAEDQPIHLRVVETAEFLREVETGEVERAETGEVLEDGKVDRKRERRKHVEVNVDEFAGLLGRACPAGVYEYVEAEAGDKAAQEEGWDGKKLVINSQNCIHCKLCDVKVPTQDITWTVPEGGGGPKYSIT